LKAIHIVNTVILTLNRFDVITVSRVPFWCLLVGCCAVSRWTYVFALL